MLLNCLEMAHAKIRERSLKKDPNKGFGFTLAHSVSRSLKDYLEEQHKLRIKHSIRLLTLSPTQIQEITKEIEGLGIPHETAKRILIANGYDYDKAVTELIHHILKTLDPEQRQWTSRAIARLIDPGDTILDIDRVLEAMIHSPKQPWKILATIIENTLQQREAQIARRKRKPKIPRGCALQDLKGDAFNMEQD